MASLLQFPTAPDNEQQNNKQNYSSTAPKKLSLHDGNHHLKNESIKAAKPIKPLEPLLKMSLVQGVDELLDLPKPLFEQFLDSRDDLDLREELFLRSKPQHSLLNYSRALYLYRLERANR